MGCVCTTRDIQNALPGSGFKLQADAIQRQNGLWLHRYQGLL
jgi:hypothetical protein